MPPRVAFWVSSFETDMEAVAAEVACLRSTLPGSIAWGISSRRLLLSRKQGISLPPRMQLAFRAATRLAQNAFDVNHIYGSLGDWFHLKAVTRKPILLTVAVDQPAADRQLLDKVDRFLVEWPAARDELIQLGYPNEKIEVIYPPVDLNRFTPRAMPEGSPVVLFASSPERTDWLAGRGVELLLSAAQLRPQITFRLLWRPWGDSLATVRRLIDEKHLTNVELHVGKIDDMACAYQEAHLTAAPFLDRKQCKLAPNSVIESLACGRPVVVTSCVGIADLIEDSLSGVVCRENADSLAAAIDEAYAQRHQMAGQARRLAEQHFDRQQFIRAYHRVYGNVLREAKDACESAIR